MPDAVHQGPHWRAEYALRLGILPRDRRLSQGEEFLEIGCRKFGQPAFPGTERVLGPLGHRGLGRTIERPG